MAEDRSFQRVSATVTVTPADHGERGSDGNSRTVRSTRSCGATAATRHPSSVMLPAPAPAASTECSAVTSIFLGARPRRLAPGEFRGLPASRAQRRPRGQARGRAPAPDARTASSARARAAPRPQRKTPPPFRARRPSALRPARRTARTACRRAPATASVREVTVVDGQHASRRDVQPASWRTSFSTARRGVSPTSAHPPGSVQRVSPSLAHEQQPAIVQHDAADVHLRRRVPVLVREPSVAALRLPRRRGSRDLGRDRTHSLEALALEGTLAVRQPAARDRFERAARRTRSVT